MANYVIFTDIFKVTWRKNVTSYVKTERHSGSGILWGTFCHQPEVSATSGSKVMGHYLFCTKVVTLTLPYIGFSKKKVLHCRVSRRHLLQKKSGRSDHPCDLWSLWRQTDKQMKAARRAGTLRNAEKLHHWHYLWYVKYTSQDGDVIGTYNIMMRADDDKMRVDNDRAIAHEYMKTS